MKQKHGLLLFLATCIPGCGQMHQGYMKRGISLLLAFCGIFALAILLELGALATFMIVVWLYAFFDSYNLRVRIGEGTAAEDAFLFGLSDMDSERLAALCRKRHSLIGWALLLAGVYLLYHTVAGSVISLLAPFFDIWWLHSLLMYDLPRLVFTVVIIALGLWFIRGPKKHAPEDIPVFVPPASAPESPSASHSATVWASEEEEAPTSPAAKAVHPSGEEAIQGGGETR
jgi:hypothetical protein